MGSSGEASAAGALDVLADHARDCGVRDLYSGDCRGCGACCSRVLPVTDADLERLRAFLGRSAVVPRAYESPLDLSCPFLTDSRECAVYEARPEVCRVYRCDLHLAGTLNPFALHGARVVDVAAEFGFAGVV